MKRAHEGLQGYLKQLRGPGEVGSTTPQPRLPLGPDAPLPIGFRPIPTSSQRPKPTNATIVYARTAVADCNDLGRSGGATPIALSMAEGDVVLTHRIEPATRAPLGQNVKVLSLNLLNHDLRNMGALTEEDAYKFLYYDPETRLHFKWCPDGVVNNLDGADPMNEFKDFALANVALQGFVRFSTLPFGDGAVGHNFPTTFTQKGVRNGDRVYLIFKQSHSLKYKRTYQFGLVLASHITTGKFVPDANVLHAWTLGRVVDGNQSKNMVTLCVGVAPVLPEAGLSVAQALDHAWLDERKPDHAQRLKEVNMVLDAAKDASALKNAADALFSAGGPFNQFPNVEKGMENILTHPQDHKYIEHLRKELNKFPDMLNRVKNLASNQDNNQMVDMVDQLQAYVALDATWAQKQSQAAGVD